MRIPKRHRHEHAAVHPATISPLTQSVSIAVNGGTPTIFNTTTSSSNCSSGSSGLTCNFVVIAPPGSDTLSVVTYSAVSGGGTPLNSGTAVVAITAGTANSAHITLGPVVSTTADSGIGSLRYAIGTASPGDTIMFMLASGSTLTIGSPLTLNTNVSIAGPGVTTSIRMHHHRHHTGRHSNVSFDGVTIDGGGAQQIFVVKSGVTATISGLILSDGLATTTNQPGGAVYNAGNLTLANDALQDNDSHVSSPYVRRHRRAKQHAGLHPHCSTNSYYGGAVYNHGLLTVTGSTFDSNVLQNDFFVGCTSTLGGAIYNDQYGTLTSSGNTYSNNEAHQGGAVFNNSTYGSASFSDDTFTGNYTCDASTGCTIAGCTGSGGCSSYQDGEGGAIYDNDGPGITVTNSTFAQNVAGGASTASIGDGGALYLGAGSPQVAGSTFTGNLAGGGTANCSEGEGGAIFEYVSAASVVELDSDTFTSNIASGDQLAYGGAVSNTNASDTGSNDTFTGNSASALGSACQSDGTAAGGAAYAYDGITMNNSTFSNNSVTANYSAFAGAVYTDAFSSLSGDTFSSNSVTGNGVNGAPHAYASGGAVQADCCLRLTGNTFTGNSATTQSSVASDATSGAVAANANLSSSGNTFTSNVVTVPAGYGYIRGAALSAGGSSWVSSGDTFTSNVATGGYITYGGAVFVNSQFTISGAKFTSNSASSASSNDYGGAIYFNTSGTISNSAFTGNSADATGSNGYGGALYDEGGSTLNGLTVSNNSASVAGGGLYVNTADTIAGATFSGNSVTNATASYGGGGVYAGAMTTVLSSTFSGNSVVANGIHSGGGAIYDNNGLSLTGSTLTSNSVTGTGSESGGGAIYVNYTAGAITNSTIVKNTTALNGGGIYTLTTPLSIVNATLYQNSAAANGGNLENEGGVIGLANTILAGGSAGTGADLDSDTSFTSNGYNIIGTTITGSGTFTPASGDQIGTNGSPLDPKLSALSNNGGPTSTLADQATSPGTAAIPWTAASGGTCGAATGIAIDQRGLSRGTGGKCDVGAYEFNGAATSIKVRAPAVRGGHRKPVRRNAPPPLHRSAPR